MKKQAIIIATGILMFSLYGCKSEKELALETIELLSNYMKNEKYDKIKEVYPDVGNLVSSNYFKSDEFLIKDVKKIGHNKIRIKIENNYVNDFGKSFIQEMIFYLEKSSLNSLKYIIYDSFGFVDYRLNNKYYEIAAKTGCIYPKIDITDQEIAKKMETASRLFSYLSFRKVLELEQQFIIKKWNWETSYRNSARGRGICVNNSTITMPNLKYQITYKNWKGETIVTDWGYVSYAWDPMYPGETKSFSIYTGYVGNATKASICLSFDTEIIENLILSSNYNGTEYYEYLAYEDSMHQLTEDIINELEEKGK